MCYINYMKRRAFTLLELVIVLLILGTLTTLAAGRYIGSQKIYKMRAFEANVNKIKEALSMYKNHQVVDGNLESRYPTSLSDLHTLFEQKPINPYTNKSMLGTNPAETGIQYISDGTSYKLCIVQRDVDDVNNNGVVEEVLPLSTKTACIGNTQTSVGVTFARNSVAYTSNGAQVGVNVPRFEQGKFGQAVLVEEGTTNLNSDPFFKTGVSGWDVGTWTTLEWLSSEYNPFSKQNGVMRLYDNDGDKGFCLKVVSISNTPHTVSVLLKILKGNINNINVGGTIYYTDSTYTDYTWNDSNTTRYDMSAIFGQGVYKLVATITPNSSKTISKYEIRISHSNTVETELLVYAIQLEEKPYATSFIDGTRAAETLTIPTAGVLNPQEGTVEFWVKTPSMEHLSSHNTTLFTTASSTNYNNSFFGYWVYSTRKLRMLVGTGTSYTVLEGTTVLQPNTWYYIVFKWTSNSASIYLNGQLEAQQSLTPNLIFSETFRIGCSHLKTEYLDSLIDDLRISNRARTDAEILSAYQSNQPLPIDENTTYALRFDNSLKVGRGGYRLSKPIYLKSLGTCNGSNISWEANIPAGCDVKVYASVDGSTFQECENNAPIPSLSEGVSLVDKVLTVKEVLLTEDGVNIPELMVVRYNVDGTVTLRG